MKKTFDFQPKLFSALKTYSKEKFMTDLMAGIIVGIVALPLAIAFGIASGVSPEKGLITAIIGGFVVSLLGGSSIQIGGPTGAFIIIVYGIIQNFGLEGLAIATVVAGILLVVMGALKLGTVIKFIPYPIVVGFTSGIALTIFTTQIKDDGQLALDGCRTAEHRHHCPDPEVFEAGARFAGGYHCDDGGSLCGADVFQPHRHRNHRRPLYHPGRHAPARAD